MTVTRIATWNDRAAAAALFDAYRQFYDQPADAALAARFIEARLRNQDAVVILATDAAGTAIGFCQLYPSFCSVLAQPIYVLYDLFVTPTHRGSGAGRALLCAAEQLAAAHGKARMDLSTAKDNASAQALYESLGWVRDEAFFSYSKRVDAPASASSQPNKPGAALASPSSL